MQFVEEEHVGLVLRLRRLNRPRKYIKTTIKLRMDTIETVEIKATEGDDEDVEDDFTVESPSVVDLLSPSLQTPLYESANPSKYLNPSRSNMTSSFRFAQSESSLHACTHFFPYTRRRYHRNIDRLMCSQIDLFVV